MMNGIKKQNKYAMNGPFNDLIPLLIYWLEGLKIEKFPWAVWLWFNQTFFKNFNISVFKQDRYTMDPAWKEFWTNQGGFLWK